MKGITATPTLEGFVAMAQHVVTNSQRQHWKTSNDANHRALASFYDGLTDKIDVLVESYQGRIGQKLDLPELPFRAEADSLMMIKSLRRYIDDNRDLMCSYREIQNQFDDILTHLNQHLYRLEQLS